jgi:uncharacterized membrane protein
VPPIGGPEPYVALTLLAALLFAAGNALQKLGLTHRLPPLSAATWLGRFPSIFAALLSSPAWLLGLALTAAAFALEMQALALGDVSVVKPLSRVQGLFVLALGVAVLGERLARAEWLGVAVIVAAAVWLGSEPGDARAVAPHTAVSLAVAIGVGALAVSGLWIADRGTSRLRQQHAPALAAGALFGVGDVLMKSATERVRGRTGGFELASADTLGALTDCPELFLSLAATALAFALQQLAFARGRVSLVVPLIGVGATVLVLVLGAALLGEAVGVSRVAGAASMLAGTLLLARGALS